MNSKLIDEYSKELDFICTEMKYGYQKFGSNLSFEVKNKSEFDEVTSIDYAVEKYLIDAIKQRDPKAHILSEEYFSDTEIRDNTWIIDPIDGTCNMTHKIPLYGMQCAYYRDNEIVCAAIYHVFHDEMFTAVKNGGAFLNDEMIGPQSRSANNAIISFGDFIHGDKYLNSLEHAMMKRISPCVEKIRMFGAASIDFAYAACGRIDGNITFTKKPWDIMPGILLCQEAGLVIVNETGVPYKTGDRVVAVFATEQLMKICMGQECNKV